MMTSKTAIRCDICVIGGGSGGLSVAAGASQMGASVTLIEKGEMGGDCLNYGCVPSKALIAAGKHAYAMSSGAEFGISPQTPEVNFERVNDHVHEVIAEIAPIDSQERFEGLGVTVIREHAQFAGPQTVETDSHVIHARRIVVATGSHPFAPPIEGLTETPYFTNETLFSNRTLPDHLIIIGGGPIGMEMAQAHRRLGASVTVIEATRILSKDDPQLSAIAIQAMEEEGVTLLEQTSVEKIEKSPDGGVVVSVSGSSGNEKISGSHLLVAAGRRPSTAGLNLDAAGIEATPRGITVDAQLRTSNKKVFAIGDVAGGHQFTHVAGYHAGIVIRNALFRRGSKVDLSAVPWVTYLDPELANVGLTEAQAREQYGNKVKTLTWPLKENDRAQAERKTQGLAKAVLLNNGRILGAGIVAPHAGELIQPWILAIQQKMKIGAMATYIAPYPTLGEISKRTAGSYYTPLLFSARTRFLVKALSRFG